MNPLSTPYLEHLFILKYFPDPTNISTKHTIIFSDPMNISTKYTLIFSDPMNISTKYTLIFSVYLKPLYLELLSISNNNFGPVTTIISLSRAFYLRDM